jgi:hypothetical protein
VILFTFLLPVLTGIGRATFWTLHCFSPDFIAPLCNATIAKGDRTILQADKGQIQFNPQREDQELLQELRQKYGNTQQKKQQQHRGGRRL